MAKNVPLKGIAALTLRSSALTGADYLHRRTAEDLSLVPARVQGDWLGRGPTPSHDPLQPLTLETLEMKRLSGWLHPDAAFVCRKCTTNLRRWSERIGFEL